MACAGRPVSLLFSFPLYVLKKNMILFRGARHIPEKHSNLGTGVAERDLPPFKFPPENYEFTEQHPPRDTRGVQLPQSKNNRVEKLVRVGQKSRLGRTGTYVIFKEIREHVCNKKQRQTIIKKYKFGQTGQKNYS